MLFEQLRLLLLLFECFTNSIKQFLRFTLINHINIVVNFSHIRRNFNGLQMHIIHPNGFFSFLNVSKNYIVIRIGKNNISFIDNGEF